ncbi:2083_t:CDS:2, partial [Cetraspora pellucida]
MMQIPSNDISLDEESLLLINSFFDDENFFDNFFNIDKEDNFFEENNSFKDTNNAYEEDRFSVNSSQENSRPLPKTESSEIFQTKHLTAKKIIHLLTPIEYPPTCKKEIAIDYHIDGWKSAELAFTDVNIYYYCIHSHSPLPPNRVPLAIRTRLQELIRQADDNTTNITPTRILTGNLIKTYFGTEHLANIHASLNNTDHFHYYVDRIQKEIHPQKQGILEVVYNYSCNLNNIHNYVKQLEFFEDNHILIICTTFEQPSEWLKCKHFQIDLSFKRVA